MLHEAVGTNEAYLNCEPGNIKKVEPQLDNGLEFFERIRPDITKILKQKCEDFGLIKVCVNYIIYHTVNTLFDKSKIFKFLFKYSFEKLNSIVELRFNSKLISTEVEEAEVQTTTPETTSLNSSEVWQESVLENITEYISNKIFINTKHKHSKREINKPKHSTSKRYNIHWRSCQELQLKPIHLQCKPMLHDMNYSCANMTVQQALKK